VPESAWGVLDGPVRGPELGCEGWGDVGMEDTGDGGCGECEKERGGERGGRVVSHSTAVGTIRY